MTPQQFEQAFLPYAQQAASGTGLLPGLFLAQWADETAYASSFAGSFNLGNIERGPGLGFVDYGSYAQFVNAEILLLHTPTYASVLAAAPKSLGDQCVALGNSPWDAGRYVGNAPYNYAGGALVALLPVFGLSAHQGGLFVDPHFLAQLIYMAALGRVYTGTEGDWLVAIIESNPADFTGATLGAVVNSAEGKAWATKLAELRTGTLNGPAGPPGPAGPSGAPGAQGATGPPGPKPTSATISGPITVTLA